MKRLAIAVICVVVLIPTSAVAAENVTITVGPAGGTNELPRAHERMGGAAGSLQAYPWVFFPYVRDGYRDTTEIDFYFFEPDVDDTDILTLEISRLGTDTVARSVQLTRPQFPWTWNGRTDNGDRASADDYDLDVFHEGSLLADGQTKIAHRTSWKFVKTKKAGSRYVSWAARGCSVKRGSRIASLNCWQRGQGGDYAKVWYRDERPRTDFKLTGRERAQFSLRVWRTPGKIKGGWDGARIWLKVTNKKYVRVRQLTWFYEVML